MKRAFFAGIALAAVAGALAISGGGVPSFLRLSSLGVNQTPDSTPGKIVSTVAASGPNYSAAGASHPGYQIGTFAARKGFLIAALSTNDFCNGTATGDLCLSASAGNIDFSLNDGGAISVRMAPNIISLLGSTSSQLRLESSGGTDNSILCVSISAGQCFTADSAGDVNLQALGVFRFGNIGGSSAAMSLTQAGVMNLKSGGDYQINGTSIAGTSTSFSLGASTPCTSTFTAATMKLVKTGNMVVASLGGTFACTLSVGAASITFASVLPAGYIPAASNGCTVQFQTGAASYVGFLNFTSTGAVAFTDASGSGTSHTQWNGGSFNCAYVLN